MAFSSGSCMPGDQEAGAGVLLAMPFFLAVTLGLFRGLLALWRASRPELRMNWLPGLTAVWVTFVLGLGATVLAGVLAHDHDLSEVLSLALIAFCLVGGLSLALGLLTWRIWLALRPASAFTWAWLPGAALVTLPALPMAAHVTGDSWMDLMAVPWIFGGVFGGPIGGVLLVGFLIEAAVRRSRARRAREALPPEIHPPGARDSS
jgi:hypothetical protein